MKSASSSENLIPVRAESFYFDDDPMAIFLVENRLFKVHRHYFIQGSEIFRDMFSQAKPCEDAATVAEGTSDWRPIVLSQVTVKEFETLLRFFYAMTLPIPNKKTLADILAFEQDEKLALLSIAHQFVFDKIFEYICEELEPEKISVADRVRLGDKYHLDKWLASAYQTILERTPDEKLSHEEANALGVERVVKVLEAKNYTLHEVYQVKTWSSLPGNNCRCPSCSSEHDWYCRDCGFGGRHTFNGRNVTDATNPTTAMRAAITQAVEKLMKQ